MSTSAAPISGLFDDAATQTAQAALDGLTLRQELVGRNLSNVDTPGYQALAVNFESALERAQNRLQPVNLQTTRPAHLAAPARQSALMQVGLRTGGSQRADGNNVDVDLELSQMAETGIRYQALTQLISKKLLLLKSIATGR